MEVVSVMSTIKRGTINLEQASEKINQLYSCYLSSK